MRYTIFVHNDNIHLIGTLFSFDPDIKDYKEIEYYQEISEDDVVYIEEDYKKIYITIHEGINGNTEFYAYKPEMTGDEKQDFYAWCRLNKQEIFYID